MVLGINFSPELTGIGKYTGEMVDWLSEQGYECAMVTSFPYYPNWKVQAPYSGKWFKTEKFKDNKMVIYRCPFYVPANPSGLKRIIHEASFFASAFITVNRLLFKPGYDKIICIAPPFHLGFLAWYYKLFKGGKINYHIQDMQIEAARDLKVVKSEWVFKVLFGLERWILKRMNSISSISVGMIRKIKAKTGRDLVMIPNWVDTEKFRPITDRASLKPKWGFDPQHKVVLYSGSIGEKQGLDALIDIAANLSTHEHIRFVICGTGPYKAKLEEMVQSRQLSNIRFLPLQGNDVFNEFLNFADVHLVLQKAEAADLVMPSKLTTILSCGGLAIATSFPGTGLYDVIHEHDMGILIDPENSVQLEDAILKACSGDYSTQKANARAYAEKYLNRDAILGQMCKDIL